MFMVLVSHFFLWAIRCCALPLRALYVAIKASGLNLYKSSRAIEDDDEEEEDE